MSGFKDIRFPPLISEHATGGPGFLTNIVASNSGKEFRDAVWSLERGEWEVSHAARRPQAYRPLQAFFRIARGSGYSFRFKDWTDFECLSSEGVFTLITATTFQMWKRYDFGGEYYDRKITKPVAGTITVSGGSGPTVASATGIVTMAGGTPLTWLGEFDAHARFGTDRMVKETIERARNREILIGWSNIPIVEVKD